MNDGKLGHINQVLGFISALKKRTQVDVFTLNLEGKHFWQSWFVGYAADFPRPDVVIGAGHKTHIPVLLTARKYKALSFLCMSPSLPIGLFDLCFVPYHDLAATTEELMARYRGLKAGEGISHNVFPTMGALHRIVPRTDVPKDINLVLIGGPSKYYMWDTNLLVQQLKFVVARAKTPVVMTTSRRTPRNVVAILEEKFPEVTIVPVEQTDSEWVVEHLARAEATWVTEDSVSMIFESVGAGCFVGLLTVPRRSVGTPRVAAGVKLLINQGYVSPFSDWKKKSFIRGGSARSFVPEAERAAEFVLKKYPHLLSTYE